MLKQMSGEVVFSFLFIFNSSERLYRLTVAEGCAAREENTEDMLMKERAKFLWGRNEDDLEHFFGCTGLQVAARRFSFHTMCTAAVAASLPSPKSWWYCSHVFSPIIKPSDPLYCKLTLRAAQTHTYTNAYTYVQIHTHAYTPNTDYIHINSSLIRCDTNGT